MAAPHRTVLERIAAAMARSLCVSVMWVLVCPSAAWCQAEDTLHDRQLATIDSLIQVGEFERAVERIEAAAFSKELSDSLWVEYRIRRLFVMRQIDQWDMLLFLSQELLAGKSHTSEQVQRVRLLRAVAMENLSMYADAGAELNTLAQLFGPHPTNRMYGEFLYRKASFHRVQGQDSLALQWVQQALAFNENEGHLKELATSEFVMALLLKGRPEVERHFLRSAALNLQVGDPLEASMIYGQVAVLLAKKRSPQARVYKHRAIVLSAKGGPIVQSIANRHASTVHEAFGELDSALYFLKNYVALRTSALIIQQNTSVRINEAERAYADLDVARSAEQDANRTAERRTWIAIALASALAIIGLLLVLLWWQFARIRRQRNELSARQEQLNGLLRDKEVLVRELHHRVKNQLTTVIALIDHQLADKDALSREQLQGIQQRIHAIARVHERLLNGIGEHSKLNSADLEDITRSLISITSRPVETRMEVDLPDLPIELAVPLMMILNELITNSIKHGGSPDIGLHIQLAMEGAYVVLRYMDSGTWKEPDPMNEDSGTGSYIIDAMVRQLHGTMERTGTTYVIRLRAQKQ